MTGKGRIKTAALLAGFLIVVAWMSAVAWKTALKVIYPLKYTAVIEQYSEQYQIDEALLFAVVKTESSFKPAAESKAGAVGLTQITPDTFRWLQTKTKEDLPDSALLDPETSVRYGAFFIRLLLDEFEQDETALAAYHAGRGRVNQWLGDRDVSPDGKSIPDIPYGDTARYVKKVMRAVDIYKNLYDIQ